jgi:hypothetical protein
MITKFSPGDKITALVPVSNIKMKLNGTVKLIAAKSEKEIQYEVELDKSFNGNEFLWFYEDELSLLKRNLSPNGGNAA